jgi:hypothetical protein
VVVPLVRGALWPSRGTKKAWQRIRDRANTKDVRIHDLRRTVGSWLAASGYGLPMIGRVLNHSQPSATAVYARLDLEPVRRALEANAQTMLEVERGAAADIVKNAPDVIAEGGPPADKPQREKRPPRPTPANAPTRACASWRPGRTRLSFPAGRQVAQRQGERAA